MLSEFRPKPKACAQCKREFLPARPMQSVCGPACASRLVRSAKKKERAEVRAKREAMKRIPDLIKEAQVAFNSFIRERDKDKGCISCGRTLRFSGSGSTGGDFDCGHFKSTGSAPHLRFAEQNAAGQCKHCNRYLAGNVVEYRKRLALRIGLAAVEALENDNRVHKWQRDELIAIRATYKAKLKELEKNEECT
jgi:hypothetical protein